MPFFSSWITSPGFHRPVELQLPAEPSAPSAEPELEPATYVDRGMELPETYDVDTVRVLVQDPFHLMVYWELRAESFRSLNLVFPYSGLDNFRPTLRLSDLDEGGEAYVSVPLAGKYWFAVTPGRRYRVDLGALSGDRGFVPIIRSNVAETMRGTISPSVDEDPKYRIDTHRFVKLLHVTGFATDKVLTDVAIADAAAYGEVPRFLTVQPPAHLVEAFHRLPETVRSAAVTVARGENLTRDMIASLPENIRAMLAEFLGSDDEELLAAVFMHLLPQLLRQVIDGKLIDEPAHPVHFAPRYAVGSSEEAQRKKLDWSWLPSMTESISRHAPLLEPDVLDTVVTTDS